MALPEKIWLGMQRGQWPIEAFNSEAGAIAWMREFPTRQIWSIFTIDASPCDLKIIPEQARLIERT